MADWNFNIDEAPRGRTEVRTIEVKGNPVEREVFVPERVILATKCGVVTVSKFLPEADRWEMLANGESPLAWQVFPEHPNTGEGRD